MLELFPSGQADTLKHRVHLWSTGGTPALFLVHSVSLNIMFGNSECAVEFIRVDLDKPDCKHLHSEMLSGAKFVSKLLTLNRVRHHILAKDNPGGLIRPLSPC